MKKTASVEQLFLSARDAAAMSGLSAGHLANLRHQKRGCKYYKRGGRVLYDRREFDAWLREEPVMTLDSMEG